MASVHGLLSGLRNGRVWIMSGLDLDVVMMPLTTCYEKCKEMFNFQSYSLFLKKNVNFFKHIIWSWNFQLPTFNLPFGCFLFVVLLMISQNFPHLESEYHQASQNRLRMFDIEEMGPNMAMDQLVSSLKMEVCQWIVLVFFFLNLPWSFRVF